MTEPKQPSESKFWGHERLWAVAIVPTVFASAGPIAFHETVHIVFYLAVSLLASISGLAYVERRADRKLARKALPEEQGRCRVSGVLVAGDRTLVSPASKTTCAAWCIEHRHPNLSGPVHQWRATAFGLELGNDGRIVWFRPHAGAPPLSGAPEGKGGRDVEDRWELEHARTEVQAAMSDREARPPSLPLVELPSDDYPPLNEWTFCDGDVVTFDAHVSCAHDDSHGPAFEYCYGTLSHGGLAALRAHWDSERWKRRVLSVPVGAGIGLVVWMVAFGLALS